MFSPTTIMFIPFLVIGAILIVASLLIRKKPEPLSDDIQDEAITVTVNQQIEKSIADADNAIDHLNKMSSMILDELENKYKELLFLYQLIDDKKVEVENIISDTANLNQMHQGAQMLQPQYLPPAGVPGAYYNGVYYNNQPLYPTESPALTTGAYSNPIYNSAAPTEPGIKDPKAETAALFNIDTASTPKDSVPTSDTIYSGEKVPSQYSDKYKDIIQLTNEGLSPPEIAQRLNMGQGEVKLILSLARVRQA